MSTAKNRWVGQFIVWHRYLGISLCLVFAVWFLSGIVLLFARMPVLSESERLAHLPRLDLTILRLTPEDAFARTGLKSNPLRITVGMIGNRPVYRFLASYGKWLTVFGDDGTILNHVDPDSAVAIAERFDQRPHSQMRWINELTAVDQWTVFDYPMARPYLPFERVSAGDGRGTIYYVSAATGSVYVATTRRGKMFAWIGAIPHWWYIRALRAKPLVWRIVVIIGSGVGVVTCLVGLLIGVLQFSPTRRYRLPGPRNSSIPHLGWKRWHYIAGAIFGLVTFTWILSGLFTMNPGNSPGPDPTDAEAQAFAGGELNPAKFHLAPLDAVGRFARCLQPSELELIVFQDRPYYLARDRQQGLRLLSAGTDSSNCISDVAAEPIVAASRRVVANAAIVDTALLSTYDTYYYDDPTYSRPLPVFRVRFADPQDTWLYVNPRTAQIQAKYTEQARVQRWLYEGLHDLHLPFLFRRRHIWQATVVGLCLGGFVLSVTSIILAKTYLQKSIKKRLHRGMAVRTDLSLKEVSKVSN